MEYLSSTLSDLELSKYKIKQADIDVVNLCKKIRFYRNTKGILIDENQYTQSDNLHLFKFIRMCTDNSLYHFFCIFTENIQPLNLRIREADKSNYSCVINFGLKHKLYMKFNFDILDKKDNIRKLEIKSFHEDQPLARTSFSMGQYRLPKFSMLIGTNDRKIGEVSQHDFKIAWGTGLYDFNILCKCINHGIYLCETRPLLEMFIRISNDSLSSIFSDLDYSYDKNSDEIEYYDEDVEEFDPEYDFLNNSKWENFKFKSMRDIGFTSYGDNIVNNTLLIEVGTCKSLID